MVWLAFYRSVSPGLHALMADSQRAKDVLRYPGVVTLSVKDTEAPMSSGMQEITQSLVFRFTVH
jgi:hypothetical protein